MDVVDGTHADEAVRNRLDRHAAAQMRQAIPAMVVGTVAVTVLLRHDLPDRALAGWLGAAAFDLARVALRLWLDAARDRPRPAWLRSTAWDVANHASFGLLWGGLVVVAGVWGEPGAMWPALVVVMAVMAMAVVASAGARYRFGVIATCALGPSVLVLLATPGWRDIGLLMLVFAAIVTAVHRTLDTALADAVRSGEENRALAAELGRFISDRDPDTALLNRRGFQAAVEALAGRAAVAGCDVTVAIANVERLAAVNELFDERTGDAVLHVLADRLRARAESDGVVVARLGGDEFAVAAPVGAVDPTVVLRAVVATPLVVDARTLHIDLHVADAVGPPARAAELTADATAEVQRSRAQRRPNLHRSPDPLALRRSLLDELPDALRSGAVEPWFQPIVAAGSRATKGWEALVRWRHPSLGVLAPDRFLPLAVMAGHAAELTDVVLDGALRFVAAELDADRSHVKVHVNVSPSDLRRPDFAEGVHALLRANRVPADALVLEITEQDMLAIDPLVIDNVERLDRAGIDFAVDDFGTGFSSLTHLQLLPIRQLKIDRSFVAALDERRSLRLVESIIGLAHGMRLRVVAEGVETEEQAAVLTAAGCPELQGYLFGRPASPEAISSAGAAARAVAPR
jgi:diguanylate cyclase (GGDEF)-like protein